MKPKKPRNPNDTTFRNINALKKRVGKLEDGMILILPLLPRLAQDMAKCIRICLDTEKFVMAKKVKSRKK